MNRDYGLPHPLVGLVFLAPLVCLLLMQWSVWQDNHRYLLQHNVRAISIGDQTLGKPFFYVDPDMEKNVERFVEGHVDTLSEALTFTDPNDRVDLYCSWRGDVVTFRRVEPAQVLRQPCDFGKMFVNYNSQKWNIELP